MIENTSSGFIDLAQDETRVAGWGRVGIRRVRESLRQLINDDRFEASANQMLERCHQLKESGIELTDYQAGKLFLMYDANRRMRKALLAMPGFQRRR